MMLPAIQPMLAVPAAPFDAAGYCFEIKLYDRFVPLTGCPGQGDRCRSREEILTIKRGSTSCPRLIPPLLAEGLLQLAVRPLITNFPGARNCRGGLSRLRPFPFVLSPRGDP
jgi:hypothetical protein